MVTLIHDTVPPDCLLYKIQAPALSDWKREKILAALATIREDLRSDQTAGLEAVGRLVSLLGL